jgi:hypothetical protein
VADRRAEGRGARLSEQVMGRVGPRDALERSVRSIWAEVLGHRNFGVHENFFALGGDSFGMVRVQARLSTTF